MRPSSPSHLCRQASRESHAHARAPTRCGSAPPPAARRSLSTQQRSHALREADTALVVLLDERARVVRSRAPLAATQLTAIPILYHCCTERRELVGCCCRCRCRYRCARRRGGVRPSSCIHACSRGSTAEAASAAASARGIGRADTLDAARVTKVHPQISTKHVADNIRRWLARDAAVDGRIGDVENLDERRRAAEDAGHRCPSASHRRRWCPRRCGRPRRSAVRLPQHRAHRRGASRRSTASGRATGRC